MAKLVLMLRAGLGERLVASPPASSTGYGRSAATSEMDLAADACPWLGSDLAERLPILRSAVAQATPEIFQHRVLDVSLARLGGLALFAGSAATRPILRTAGSEASASSRT